MENQVCSFVLTDCSCFMVVWGNMDLRFQEEKVLLFKFRENKTVLLLLLLSPFIFFFCETNLLDSEISSCCVLIIKFASAKFERKY